MDTIDIRRFAAMWDEKWDGHPPIPVQMSTWFRSRWLRFDVLPDDRRYGRDAMERAEVLRRYNRVLSAVFDNRTMLISTCSWSEMPEPKARDGAIAELLPDAEYWRSDNVATDPQFQSWQHRFLSAAHLDDQKVPPLLSGIANDQYDGVLIVDLLCESIVWPFDGGISVYCYESSDRSRLYGQFNEWLYRPADR